MPLPPGAPDSPVAVRAVRSAPLAMEGQACRIRGPTVFWRGFGLLPLATIQTYPGGKHRMSTEGWGGGS